MNEPPNPTTERRSLDEVRRLIERTLPGRLVSYGAGHLVWVTMDGWRIEAQVGGSITNG